MRAATGAAFRRMQGRIVPEHLELTAKYLREPGVEIGAFLSPIEGIRPYYVDRFAEYALQPTRADWYGDAADLPFHDESLQYVATSHVLEHAANPLAALAEWARVLRHGGIVYMVVPDRRRTWDHGRPLTTVEHMLADFRAGTTQVDPTHIDDFVHGIDWAWFSPSTPAGEEAAARAALAAEYREKIARGDEINIHFHTFEPSNALALIEAGNAARLWPGRFEILECLESFPTSRPDGFLIVARWHKSLWARMRGTFSKPAQPLRAEARKPVGG